MTAQTIAAVLAGWTGIPVGKMLADEIHTVLALEDGLARRVIGQSHALATIAQRMRTARANLTDPRRPVGVFLLVGPSGVDQYGQIRVQFHWDREGQRNERSSCWMRVAQSWAGKQWGTLFLPRIGHEVIVNFLDGDPDQPMITASVYNAENMPPYDLPGQQTRSGIKTTSTADGGPPMCNELRFEDKKDAEEIYLHAQKDFTRVVKHDDSLKIAHDQTIEITHNRTETITDGDEHVTIAKGKRTVSIMGNDSLTLTMGNQTTTLNLGKSTTEAMQGIELKVGANSIVIDQSGITLKGLMIKLEGNPYDPDQSPHGTGERGRHAHAQRLHHAERHTHAQRRSSHNGMMDGKAGAPE